MADWRKDRVIMCGWMLMMVGVFFVGETKAESLEELGMVFVKGGCYEMGDTFGDGIYDERPVHEVCLDDFYMGQYEVTVGAFKAFVDETGYKTEAEQEGGCLYFEGPIQQRAGKLEQSRVFADREASCGLYQLERCGFVYKVEESDDQPCVSVADGGGVGVCGQEWGEKRELGRDERKIRGWRVRLAFEEFRFGDTSSRSEARQRSGTL